MPWKKKSAIRVLKLTSEDFLRIYRKLLTVLLFPIDSLMTMVTGIEFWMSFMINNLISTINKSKPMNIFKNVIVGVVAILWSPSNYSSGI